MTKPIMGIDAGFQAMGVVIAQGSEIIFAETCRTAKTAAKHGVRVADDDTERCQRLARFLVNVVRTYEPAGAVVEMPSGGAQGARANRSMGMATAIVAAILEVTGVPLEVVTPQAVKEAAGGKKNAAKSDVQARVSQVFDWRCEVPKDVDHWEHIADAAGALMAAKDGVMMRTLERLGA